MSNDHAFFRKHLQSGQAEECRLRKGSTKVCYLLASPDPPISRQNPPPILYRYMKRSHGESFLKTGRIRLNTLFSYANTEELLAAQFDSGEGTVTAVSEDSGEMVAHVFTSLDCWTMCFSSDLDQQIADDFEADFVFKVTSYEFFIELARGMAEHSSNGRLHKVRYFTPEQLQGMTHNEVKKLFARECKHASFSHQNEYRICFESRRKTHQIGQDQLPALAGAGFGQSSYEREQREPPEKARERTRALSVLEPVLVTRGRLTRFAEEVAIP